MQIIMRYSLGGASSQELQEARMEAGKARIRGDTLRQATSDEGKLLQQENERLKQLTQFPKR
jgi:hypothetical protein